MREQKLYPVLSVNNKTLTSVAVSNERNSEWLARELDCSSLRLGFYHYCRNKCQLNDLLHDIQLKKGQLCVWSMSDSDASCREVNHLYFRCGELRIVFNYTFAQKQNKRSRTVVQRKAL
jgi:hypothetical protein